MILGEEKLLNENYQYIETSRNIYNLPLYIDETPAITIATLSNRARRQKTVWSKFNLRCI